MIEKATLAGGCFWCTEAIFQRLKGVKSVTSGFSGGTTDLPTYDQVVSGTTGHAESIQIEFDPSIISYSTLLDVFWHTHNPTTLNQQGYDTGTQYRSIIFFHDENQKNIAKKSKKDFQTAKTYPDPIVTEIVPYRTFSPADSYHKDYYNRNKNAPYCSVIIDPKIKKLMTQYSDQIKAEYKK